MCRGPSECFDRAARTVTLSDLRVSRAIEADLRISSAISNGLQSGTRVPPACSFEKAMAFCRVSSSSSSPADARRIRSSIRALSSKHSSERAAEFALADDLGSPSRSTSPSPMAAPFSASCAAAAAS
eukprot:6186877-Pleurochrysis_carterae.AAC.1